MRRMQSSSMRQMQTEHPSCVHSTELDSSNGIHSFSDSMTRQCLHLQCLHEYWPFQMIRLISSVYGSLFLLLRSSLDSGNTVRCRWGLTSLDQVPASRSYTRYNYEEQSPHIFFSSTVRVLQKTGRRTKPYSSKINGDFRLCTQASD